MKINKERVIWDGSVGLEPEPDPTVGSVSVVLAMQCNGITESKKWKWRSGTKLEPDKFGEQKVKATTINKLDVLSLDDRPELDTIISHKLWTTETFLQFKICFAVALLLSYEIT